MVLYLEIYNRSKMFTFCSNKSLHHKPELERRLVQTQENLIVECQNSNRTFIDPKERFFLKVQSCITEPGHRVMEYFSVLTA